MNENLLYYGDNLSVLRKHVADESVDLIYLDPPFQSGRNYNIFFKNEAGAGSEEQVRAFKDTWSWGREAEENYETTVTCGDELALTLQALRKILGESDLLAYLVMMAPRLRELHRVLKPKGTLYLHCDPHASHYLKVLLDACFGGGAFRNELIWRYRRMPSKSRDFQRFHDVIFRYTKNRKGEAIFNQLYDELAESTKNTWGTRKQNAVFGKDGRRLKSSTLQEESPGVPMGDVWDISIIAPLSKERLGYPTQKPERLLERILLASSNPGDVVLDPFCGCGTAVAVAQRLNRRWIGIDITHLAVGLIKYRMKTAFGDQARFMVKGEPTTVAAARQLATENPYQFQWWFIGRILGRPVEEKKGRDQGVDGRLFFRDDSKVELKQIVLSVKSGRTGPAHVRDLRGVLERERLHGAEMAALLLMHEPTAEMQREAATAGYYNSPWGTKHPRIQLFTVQQLLSGEGLSYPAPFYSNLSLRKAVRPQSAPLQVELPGIRKAVRASSAKKGRTQIR